MNNDEKETQWLEEMGAITAKLEPKPLLEGPKRQHFLPRFYLEGFAKDGKVAVFDRIENEVRVQQPVNTAVIGHFYTMVDDQGRKRFELEQLLAEYEGKAKPAIEKLALKDSLNADERSDLAIFIALGAMRTPDIVDSIKKVNSESIKMFAKQVLSDPEALATKLSADPKYAGLSQEELKVQAKEMVEFAQSDNYEVTTNEKWAVGTAMRIALELAPIFAGRDWRVLHRDSEKKSFVTSDAPVLLTTVTPRPSSIYGVGFGNADALVAFPLTASCVLAMSGKSGSLDHATIDSDRIRRANLAMAQQCQRFVVGRDEALVKSLTDHLSLAKKKWQPKMQMN